MSFVITRKTAPKPEERPALPRMIYRNEREDRGPRFWDDIQMLQAICRQFGWDVDPVSCQCIWRRLSLEHPLAKQFGSTDPWFTAGNMYSMFTKERIEPLLRPA